ncbi:hypothetical protein [Caballeronia sp. INDeC2]|uniref:hypothetical protein n=1 Tax=Caballeronia sp. INDeC2 TaxID=2921747 RepID=UPI0020297FAF|nr:hypothetical protein [Caballeronia sp. INDeC2]
MGFALTRGAVSPDPGFVSVYWRCPAQGLFIANESLTPCAFIYKALRNSSGGKPVLRNGVLGNRWAKYAGFRAGLRGGFNLHASAPEQ